MCWLTGTVTMNRDLVSSSGLSQYGEWTGRTMSRVEAIKQQEMAKKLQQLQGVARSLSGRGLFQALKVVHQVFIVQATQCHIIQVFRVVVKCFAALQGVVCGG